MHFLEKIFSVKNECDYKVIRVFGIKILKFLNSKKILKELLKNQEVNFEKMSVIQDNLKKVLLENSKNNKEYFNTFNNALNNLNVKYKKEFIKDNIDNPNYAKIEQELYNFYEAMKTIKFYKIFQNRINFDLAKPKIDLLNRRFKKNSYILTDIEENFPQGYSKITSDEIKKHKDEDCIFILAYSKDFLALDTIKVLESFNLKYYALQQPYPLARYFHIDKNAFETLDEEQKSENWHFCPVDFENIFQLLNQCKNLEGDYVEIGTFKGDSASAALNYMKKENINKKAYLLDTFVGFDYEEAYNSQDACWQNTHKQTSYEEVKKRLEKYGNANIIQTNIISNELPDEIDKICLANIDVDMYEAVKAALYKVKDKIVKNGIIIAEDYGHTPGLIGAQKATNEFLEENPDKFISIYLNSGQLLLINKG